MSGPYTTVVNSARKLLADCYHWRRIASEITPWDDEDAFSHTHHSVVDESYNEKTTGDDLEREMPYALFELHTFKSETRAVGCYRVSGVIRARVVVKVPDRFKGSERQSLVHAVEVADLLAQTNDLTKPGMLDLAGRGGYLSLKNLVLDNYFRTHSKERSTLGDGLILDFVIDFGGN